MAFEKIEDKGNIFEFEKDGDEIEGVLVKVRHDVGQFKSSMYTIEKDEEEFEVFGSAVLDKLMEKIAVGDLIRIVYKGKKKGKNYHLFEVYRDEDQASENHDSDQASEDDSDF